MTYRLSLAERIAATGGLRPSDKEVLQALARSAHFETGMNAHPSLDTLVARSGLSRATVARCLVRLEDASQPGGPWIIATARAHRHATTYRLNLDRLATNASGTKVVARDHRSESQNEMQSARNLSLTLIDQSLILEKFESQNETPIPSTYPDLDPSAPALRAGPVENPARTTTSDEAKVDGPTQPTVTHADLRADRRGDSDDATGGPTRPRSDQASPLGARVPLPQRSDSPRPASPAARPASVEPHQQTLGPLDINPSPARAPQWGQLADALRKGLQRKSG